VRVAALVLFSLILTVVGAAAQTMECTRIAGESPPGVMEAVRYRVRIEAGRASTIMLDLRNGQTTTTLLAPVRDEPGRSMRLATFPAQNGAVSAVFNLVTVQPDGEVLMETWVRPSDSAAEVPPRHIWYRLRCQPGGGK